MCMLFLLYNRQSHGRGRTSPPHVGLHVHVIDESIHVN